MATLIAINLQYIVRRLFKFTEINTEVSDLSDQGQIIRPGSVI